jgi:hypothetical protein
VNADPFLRRLESTAIVVCIVMALVALLFSSNRIASAVAVLGGGALAGFSYWTIGASVGALGRRATGGGARRRPRLGWIVLKVFFRYALLVLFAYVMIARLRLPPLGLLAGASSVVAAASVEAVRVLLKKS